MVIGTGINVAIAPSDISKERCRAFYNKQLNVINNCLFMSNLEQRIPQEQTSEIFALATEIQARHDTKLFRSRISKNWSRSQYLARVYRASSKADSGEKKT